MRTALAALSTLVALTGCADGLHWSTTPPIAVAPAAFENPMLLQVADHEAVWEGVVDVVGNYFRIDREDPVRLLGNTLTEGRIDTFPKTGATIFEPWDHDSANSYERLESTLQSIRRRAVIRVIPAQGGGFWIDLAVFKDLENLRQPEHSTAGASTPRFDTSLTRVVNPDQAPDKTLNWIYQGRDVALEQRMLGEIQFRFTPAGQPVPVR